MKVFLVLFLGMLSCISFAHANPNETYHGSRIEKSDIPQQARVYVQTQQIHVDVGAIFIELSGNLYQVSQICQDENGFYVPYTGFWWTCVNGHPNPPWQLVCWICGSVY